MSNATVAILMHDTIKGLGLKNLLEQSFSVTVSIAKDTETIVLMGENVDYIFTDPLTHAACIKFFIPRQGKTIVVSETATASDNSDTTMLCSSDGIETIKARLARFVDRHYNSTASSDGILSTRETEVLRLVASGFINKEIAEELSISVNTVLTHRKNITAKLGIKSTSGLSFYALMNGIIAPK